MSDFNRQYRPIPRNTNLCGHRHDVRTRRAAQAFYNFGGEGQGASRGVIIRTVSGATLDVRPPIETIAFGTSGGPALTVRLPSADTEHYTTRILKIKKTDSGVNTIYVNDAAETSDLIDGKGSMSLAQPNELLQIQSDTNTWHVFSRTNMLSITDYFATNAAANSTVTYPIQLVLVTAANSTHTLPAPELYKSAVVRFKRMTNTAGVTTIVPNIPATVKIDEVLNSVTMNTQYQALGLKSNGAHWYRVEQFDP
jgi:hypothetical protein